MFGEGLGGQGTAARDTCWSWFGCGAMGTAYGLGNSRNPGAPGNPQPPFPGAPALCTLPTAGFDGAVWFRFSSRHAAVVQFCFGDVSTRGLRFGSTTTPNGSVTAGSTPVINGNNNSDWAVLQQLAGRKEGFNQDISTLSE
jgi:hypothetical protein